MLSLPSKRRLSYQGDKILIWRKKIKDGCHDLDIFRTFWKIDAV